jgi:PPOX class probable F420-dependent enzyme
MPSLPRAIAEERLAAARVAHLATVSPEGTPHVVPVCFAVQDGRLYTAVDDAKPKATRALQRLENVRAHGHASLLVDHYEEDWAQLWWVRVDGTATIEDSEPALDALAAKYAQYRDQRPPGPLIAIAPERWRSWSATSA